MRTATGEWRPKIADSEIESAYGVQPSGNRHDFAGAYVREPDAEPGDSAFWPLEDIHVGWEEDHLPLCGPTGSQT